MKRPTPRLICGAAMLMPTTALASYVFNASDFATSVVADATTPATSANALGRPSIDTNGNAPNTTWPVLPVYQPFAPGQLASLNPGQSLTLQFDHKILDDPRNPYGMDFTVFGNSNWLITSGFWTNGDPHSTGLTNSIFNEPGTVSVSQDDSTWFTFTVGPFADDFAPTLGRVLLNSNASGSWWGDPTDPTLPLNPAITLSAYAGQTVADLTSAYGQSAGGTSFDIDGLNLPADPTTGLKWIQYVRISNSIDSEVTPDIDAVADVAPLPEPSWLAGFIFCIYPLSRYSRKRARVRVI